MIDRLDLWLRTSDFAPLVLFVGFLVLGMATGIQIARIAKADQAPTPTPIVCLFDCAENDPGCTNDSFCLGPCVCDLDLEECVPE